MMKAFKKIFALVLALVMAFGMGTKVNAADGDLTSDDTISVTDLTAGDQVKYYQIIEWVDGEGWKFKAPYATALSAADLTEILGTPAIADDPATPEDEHVDAVPGKISYELAKKIAAVAATPVEAAETLTGTTWSKSNPAPGLYMVVATASKSGVVYNPAFVAADFKDGGTNTISITATYDNDAVAKKTTFTTKKTVKEAEDAINKAKASLVGDIVGFDVESSVPVFLDSYKNPSFTLTDEISAGMELVIDATHLLTVHYGTRTATFDGTTVTDTDPANLTIVKDSATKYTIDFTAAYLKSLTAPQDVTVEYYGKVTNSATFNVNWDKNTVTVTYSNGPDTEKGIEKDVTNHYTFSIGADIIGKQGKKGYEAVKVGVDAEGKELTELREVTLDNGDDTDTARSLEGATFGLYTDAAKAAAAERVSDTDGLLISDIYTTGALFTTGADGVISFKGLDGGTAAAPAVYYLKELDAPAGYVKDTDVHEVKIWATYEEKTITETVTVGGTPMEVTYTTSVLKDYTVEIDGHATKYEFNNEGPTIVDPEIKDITTDEDRIKNTKGVELPSTGGIGTTMFYIFGGLLVMGASLVLITRRRMNA